MDKFAPHTFNLNPQELTKEGHKLESKELLKHLAGTAEQLTPNDAVRLAQWLLVGVYGYGIQANSEFQSAGAVEKYVRKAINDLRGLSLS